MIFNVTFGFEGKGVGWSESHAMKMATEDPEVVKTAAIAIAEKRVMFLGREFTLNVIRVSAYSNDAGTERVKGVALSEKGWANPIQTVAMAAEPAVVALKVIGTTSATLAPAAFKWNSNRTYCGAPPDPCVDNGGDVDENKSNLGANFGQWRSLMLINCGWLVSSMIADRDITAITQLASGKVEITFAGGVIGGMVDGLVYPIRVRQVNGSHSPMNSAWNAKYVAPNKLVTQEVIGLALAQEGGAVKIYHRIRPFAGFANLVLAGKTAKHQRGRPFGSIRGRAPNRVKG